MYRYSIFPKRNWKCFWSQELACIVSGIVYEEGEECEKREDGRRSEMGSQL